MYVLSAYVVKLKTSKTTKTENSVHRLFFIVYSCGQEAPRESVFVRSADVDDSCSCDSVGTASRLRGRSRSLDQDPVLGSALAALLLARLDLLVGRTAALSLTARTPAAACGTAGT